MIKAGALLYAMFLVIVSSIISSTFILSNYYNNTYVLQVLKQEQLFKDVHSGINYGLAFHQEIPFHQEIELDLFDDEMHQVKLYKKSWGAFYMLTSSANWRNKSAIKTAFIGATIDEEKKIAIYLSDQNKPLSIAGATTIVGDCFLPKAGVKRAYIDGVGFLGHKLIEGETRNSDNSLPLMNQKLFDENYIHFSIKELLLDSIVDFASVQHQDTIVNSFQNKTLVLYSTSSIVLENKHLEGNIKLIAEQTITVKSSVKLNNLLLYAKGIIIEENTVANLQLFATDSVMIQDHCILTYPSVVSVLGKRDSELSRKITIGKEVKIKGVIFLMDENTNQTCLSKIAIDEKTEIMGNIYSTEFLELKGEVIGGVFCKNFVLKTPSSIYQNHIMNATIDRKKLPKEFVGVALTEEINHHQIIKWLD